MNKTILTIATIALTYFILVTSFYLVYYNTSFYEENFESLAYPNLGEEKTNNIFNDLKEYLDKDKFGYNRVHLLSEFTESEQSHMQDVKRIIDFICILYIVSIIVLVILFYYSRNVMAKALTFGAIASLAFVVVIGLASLFNFSDFWTLFHKVLFPQGNWAFPIDSLLKTLFPDNFFKEFALKISLITIIFSSAILTIKYNLKK